MRILVTGAGGFLGSAIVRTALARGHAVRAVARRTPTPAPVGAETVVMDLAEADAGALAALLDGVDAVIHAAAAMSGDDARHARDTVGPTRALLDAATACPAPPRLVLVSSMAVYNCASVPAGAALDETSALEPEPAMRDAYCRAKLAQEALAVAAAQNRGLVIRVMRPGVVFGPGRLWTARLGVAARGLAALVGGAAPTPGVSAEDCAVALVLGAETVPQTSDLPMPDGRGAVEIFNVAAPDQPDQRAWAAACGAALGVRAVLRLPCRPLRAAAQALALVGILAPGLARRVPGPLRLETFDARFKPLFLSAARIEDRLGWRASHPTLEALRAIAENRT